jgi:hypothetical protein
MSVGTELAKKLERFIVSKENGTEAWLLMMKYSSSAIQITHPSAHPVDSEWYPS